MPLVEFAYNNSYQASIGMAPYEELYGRPCRSPTCWLEAGESSLFGPDIVRKTTEKIQLIWERLRRAQSRHKSYADRQRRPLEFQEGDYVFLKVSPKKGVFRFGKKGKLAPRYIGPFEVIKVLVAQLVVGTTSNGYLSSWSQVRAHGGERNPCELGG